MTTAEAARLLLGWDELLLLTHVRPDGDTVGSAAALCQALRDRGKTAYLLPNPELTATYAPYAAPYAAPEGFVPRHVVSVDIAALSLLPELFGESIPWRVHKSEGAMFLWLWFEGLPITCQELYERCKSRGCFVNPGHHFFFALPEEGEPWPHRHECIRISFTQTEELLRKGLSIVADEVRKAYSRS